MYAWGCLSSSKRQLNHNSSTEVEVDSFLSLTFVLTKVLCNASVAFEELTLEGNIIYNY